eukprot:TRINITY_DN6392_c0_g1_i1.p1 TRINITY_DN6392_c0_g1~~TRINITY_DN6392_c0_g1_i1.p1  ORF type:complete len:211 (-),score=45.78 TRINITY_DN6392_c0_g1_i1:29-661(-)
MRYLHNKFQFDVPEGVKLNIKKRVVTVSGPRGTLTRSFEGKLYDFILSKDKKKLSVECWFGKQADYACLKTIVTHISNMCIGVTKGFKYKMRFAYAHFPINVNITEDSPQVVEIRNFLGGVPVACAWGWFLVVFSEKLVRRVRMKEGVTVTRTDPAKQKDEIVLVGNDVEIVSRSAADIHGSILVTDKDIRKFLDGIYVSVKETELQDEE